MRVIPRGRYWAGLLSISACAALMAFTPGEWRWVWGFVVGAIYGGTLARYVRLPRPKPTDAEREQPERERL